MTGFNDKPILSFNCVHLEPLMLQHEDGLREVVCDGGLWELVVTSVPTPDQMAAYIQTASATRTAFAVIDERSGEVVGSTNLYHVDKAVPRVGIGFTWYAQSVQRTHVNTSCRLMLLIYAFETLGCVCVGWRTNTLNATSQRTTERLDTRKDDILRRHQIRKDGSVHDTVICSMLREEWPTTWAVLCKRLGQGTEAR